MAFVNAHISAQDRVEYQLDRSEASRPLGVLMPTLSWTVDHRRGAYLRDMGHSNRGPEPNPNPNPASICYSLHFFVEGQLYLIKATRDFTQDWRNLDQTQKLWKEEDYLSVNSIEPSDQRSKTETFQDMLVEALNASKGGDPHMAMYLAEQGWTVTYKLTLR